MAIDITGDCHGDYRRFNTDCFPEQKEMTKDDYVIVCGDFGFWSTDPEQLWWRNWLEKKPFTTLWVDGNHENYDMLNEYPIEEWCGGKIQRVMPSVIHLMRGQVYEIDDCRIFTFGGAQSHGIQGGLLTRRIRITGKRSMKLMKLRHSGKNTACIARGIWSVVMFWQISIFA